MSSMGVAAFALARLTDLRQFDRTARTERIVPA